MPGSCRGKGHVSEVFGCLNLEFLIINRTCLEPTYLLGLDSVSSGRPGVGIRVAVR